ncbi:MAG: TIGR01777 family protein [Acidobacteria bacterium]|nr:TIGR01777 family protein [Acidobacteriota bacterium]
MRILLSGATGFVGRALCDSLIAGGSEVYILSRSPQKAKLSLPRVSEAFHWTAGEAPPPEAFDGVHAVVHLAGESVVGRWTDAKRRAITDSRVMGTRHLVDGLRRCSIRPRILVSASAIGYYGDRGEEDLVETSEPGDDFLAKTAIAWEREARQAEDLDMRVVRLRTGIVLAKDGGALGQMLLPAKLGLSGPLGPGTQWWSWIHRDDLMGMIRFAIEEEDLSGPLNCVAPNPMRQREFSQTLGKVLHRPAFLPAPSIALELLLGGFATELLSSKRVLPSAAMTLGYPFAHPNLEGALRAALDR